ncbi:MAG TPA: 50S ribosomal protein L9 [Phycisphaeraceae bacterium]|nr:50S ribosomal protein L9 [Phycisphaeraceae bacterium]
MARNVQLLLTENVEHLGIVGDVVNVKAGYARNYLLPRGLGTEPSEEKIAALAERRAEAEKEMKALRAKREGMIEKLSEFELTIERSCNDQGHLYGSVTQNDIATALIAEGFDVKQRDIRIAHPIKRLDSYEIPVVFETDLRTTFKLWVIADRHLDMDDRPEMEFDDEGNLIEVVHEEPAEETEETQETEEKAPAADES